MGQVTVQTANVQFLDVTSLFMTFSIILSNNPEAFSRTVFFFLCTLTENETSSFGETCSMTGRQVPEHPPRTQNHTF